MVRDNRETTTIVDRTSLNNKDESDVERQATTNNNIIFVPVHSVVSRLPWSRGGSITNWWARGASRRLAWVMITGGAVRCVLEPTEHNKCA